MDGDDPYRNLSEKEILHELLFGCLPVLNDRELEAGYGACKKYMEVDEAATLPALRLLFDKSTRLGYKDEAEKIALQDSTSSEATVEMFSTPGKNTSTQPKNEEEKKKKTMKKKKKKKPQPPFGSTHQQVAASSSHPNEEEEYKLALPQQEGTTPATRCLPLLDKLKTELRLAMAEAADEGLEEKPVYTRISRCLHLIEKIDILKTELRLDTAEAVDEGEEEKPANCIKGRFGKNTSTQPKNEEKKKKKKKKKKKPQPPFGSTHQQVAASSSHPKEFEKEQWTIAASSSSMTKKSDQCISIGGYESLPLKNQQKEAAPAQIGVVYVPKPLGIAEDMEVGKGERSVFVCISNLTQGRHGCDWYRLDPEKKECSKISSRLEWGGKLVEMFSVATAGSIIYILGGVYPGSCHNTSELDKSCCNDVFYLDFHHPRDGWKAGPQLPSPYSYPLATSMNDTVYFFNSRDVFARALDTSDPESGWKSLAASPNLKSPLCFVNALPDPIRDRILLVSSLGQRFFAYYPSKEELECIDSNQMPYDMICSVSTVVDGVLYYIQCDSGLLCAYDLNQQKNLTPEYSFKVHIVWHDDWQHMLDLGGGKLCLVRYVGWLEEEVRLLKFKVQKEAGGDKVHITVVSVEIFRILEDGSTFRHTVAL